MPKVPRRLRRCTFCASTAIGDERHRVFDCPHFQGLRLQHAEIFRDSHDAMRSVFLLMQQSAACKCWQVYEDAVHSSGRKEFLSQTPDMHY